MCREQRTLLCQSACAMFFYQMLGNSCISLCWNVGNAASLQELQNNFSNGPQRSKQIWQARNKTLCVIKWNAVREQRQWTVNVWSRSCKQSIVTALYCMSKIQAAVSDFGVSVGLISDKWQFYWPGTNKRNIFKVECAVHWFKTCK